MRNKRDTYVYELFDSRKIVYIGITDDLERREQEHLGEGKKFTSIRTISPKLTKESALEREDERISQYQKGHNGRTPKYNKK